MYPAMHREGWPFTAKKMDVFFTGDALFAGSIGRTDLPEVISKF